MSQFRTTFDIPDPPFSIDYSNAVFSIGSCFAEHIADRLGHFLFDVLSNPNGIIFNPVSLAEQLRNIVEAKVFEKNELVEHEGLFHSWNHHHSTSRIDADQLISEINRSNAEARTHLLRSKTLLVTFGTAFAYRYRDTGKIVANCHKIPNHRFDKIRLNDHRIIGEWQDTIELLQTFNPDLNILFTVSPVRHIKDGIVANQRSKSMLLLAVEALTLQFENAHYFPSYEIMMDDLRDYRYYNADMLHPNDVAIDYIWDQFVQSHMSNESQEIMKKVDQLQKARAHRPVHPDSEASIEFRKSTEVKWQDLLKQYPMLKSE